MLSVQTGTQPYFFLFKNPLSSLWVLAWIPTILTWLKIAIIIILKANLITINFFFFFSWFHSWIWKKKSSSENYLLLLLGENSGKCFIVVMQTFTKHFQLTNFFFLFLNSPIIIEVPQRIKNTCLPGPNLWKVSSRL